MADHIQRLQQCAGELVQDVYPGGVAESVQVLDRSGRVLALVAVPAGLVAVPRREEPEAVAGWVVTERKAAFDGRTVPLSGRKLDVLRVLVDREVATVDELRPAWHDYAVEDSTIRWTIGELKKALVAAFPDFPGEAITASGSGYRLTLR